MSRCCLVYPGQPAAGDRDQDRFPHPWGGGVCGVHGQTGQEGRRQQERKGNGRQPDRDYFPHV